MTTLIRASALTGFQSLVRELGEAPEILLRQFNLPAEDGENVEKFIPHRSVVQLLEAASVRLGCADFGLRLAEKQDIHILGPVAVIAKHSATAGEAIESINKYMHFYSPAIRIGIDFHTLPRHARLLFDMDLKGIPNRTQAIELALGVAKNVMSLLTEGHFTVESVLFRHERLSPEAVYEAHFGARALFDQDVNALVFKSELLERPLDHRDPYAKKMVADYLERSIPHQSLDIREQVDILIARLLPTMRCSLPIIAEHLSLHERTLQRQLAQAGVVFEDLVDSIRREHAENYLGISQMPMKQIAGLLGYNGQSSFNRACLRWFGAAPLQIRERLRGRE